MKTTLLTLALVLSQASFAAIVGSDYEVRHQNLIEEAVNAKCIQPKVLEVLSSTKKIIRVDQGITDAEFTTVLEGRVRLDQNVFDTYQVTVRTNYYDNYDHESKEHGVYTVESVKCEIVSNN